MRTCHDFGIGYFLNECPRQRWCRWRALRNLSCWLPLLAGPWACRRRPRRGRASGSHLMIVLSRWICCFRFIYSQRPQSKLMAMVGPVRTCLGSLLLCQFDWDHFWKRLRRIGDQCWVLRLPSYFFFASWFDEDWRWLCCYRDFGERRLIVSSLRDFCCWRRLWGPIRFGCCRLALYSTCE